MRQVVEDPAEARALSRDNLALYADYSGDFQTGETGGASDRQSRAPFGAACPGVRAVGAGPVAAGGAKPTRSSGRSTSWARPTRRRASATSRSTRAVSRRRAQIFARGRGRGCGGQESRPRRRTSSPRSRYAAALAQAERRRDRGRREGAGEQQGREDPIPGGAGRSSKRATTARARTLAAGLGAELQAEPQAYAKIIEGASRAEERRSAPGDQDC